MIQKSVKKLVREREETQLEYHYSPVSYLWSLQNGPCNCDALFLASRYLGSLLPNVGVVLIREGRNKIVGVGELACGLHLGDRSRRQTILQILANRTVEENWLLRNETHLVTEPCYIQFLDVDSFKFDSSNVWIIESLDELDN